MAPIRGKTLAVRLSDTEVAKVSVNTTALIL